MCVWHYDHIAILPHWPLMNLGAVTVNKTELKRGGCIKTILPNLYIYAECGHYSLCIILKWKYGIQ